MLEARQLGVVYTGIVGSYVVPALQTAKRSLDIVSPYLSPKYSQLLLSKAKSGVVVRVLTSNSSGLRHQQALAMLGPSSELYFSNPKFRYCLVAIIGIGVVVSSLFGAIPLVLSAMAALIVIVFGVRKRPRSQYGLRVKVAPANQLVHVKLYIVDKQVAFSGSANLTYSGMSRNIERLEVKTFPEEVKQEVNTFAALWGPERPPTGSDSSMSWKNKPIFREIT